jgi:hypothetical protein
MTEDEFEALMCERIAAGLAHEARSGRPDPDPDPDPLLVMARENARRTVALLREAAARLGDARLAELATEMDAASQMQTTDVEAHVALAPNVQGPKTWH